jgi:hypothetical protein
VIGSVLALALATLSEAGGLPKDAILVDDASLPASVHPDRALLLWMEAPKTGDCPEGWEETWTTMCPDSTTGCHYTGRTRVSLVDTVRGRLLNTITIREPLSGGDSFDVPYRLGPGGPYHVDQPFGKPTLVWLRDYDGDGLAMEFALFEAASCSALFATLIGYDAGADAVIQYRFLSSWRDPEGRWHKGTGAWKVGMFSSPPTGPGHWKYTWDAPGAPHAENEVWYRGHGLFEVTTIQRPAGTP